MLKTKIIEEISDDSSRLFLRKISSSDAKFFYESLTEISVSKYLSLGPLESLDHAKKIIKSYLKSWDQMLQFNYVIELRNKEVKKIGSISVWGISWLHRRAEIGIWINSKYWNQGIGEKAINLVKIIAYQYLNLNRLEAHIVVDNTKSINLFKKCEFEAEGLLKQYLNFKGTFFDAYILACIKKL